MNALDQPAGAAMAPQEVSLDVLREKYAKGEESSILDVRRRGIPIVLISHNMPQVFEVADRIHVQRLGSRAAIVTPQTHTMNDAVAIMTGALKVDEKDQALGPVRVPATA